MLRKRNGKKITDKNQSIDSANLGPGTSLIEMMAMFNLDKSKSDLEIAGESNLINPSQAVYTEDDVKNTSSLDRYYRK